ncbi:MAG: hypothetical protein N2C14_22835 [Planctomycetales bacterium]
MNEQLVAELSSQRIVAQFVPLRVNSDRPDGRKWASYFPHQAEEAVLFVIRADRKKLYAREGIPDNLPRFLRDHLKLSGTILTKPQRERASQAIDAASRLYFDGDIDGAIKAIARHANSGSYAQVAQRADRLAARLASPGRRALAKAKNGLVSGEESLGSALLLLDTQRVYGRLPELRKPLNDALLASRQDPAVAPLFEQAKLINQAREEESKGRRREALAAYRQVASNHPNTKAAELAGQAAEKLQAEGSEEPLVPNGPPSKADQRKAASYLQLAKTLKNPDKAREDAEKVLKLTPKDSPLAQEAQALLDRDKR